MTVEDGRPARVPPTYLALFALVYAVQGVVLAYFLNFNALYMRGAGVAEGRIADVQSLALVPFILKFLGGPISDRFNLLGLGHRRPYIALGLVTQSLGLLGLSRINPGTHLGTFAGIAVLTVIGLAMYDTCCDGMVVDITPDTDRPRVQGILMGSRFLTATVFTELFGLWLGHGGGYHATLWACAAIGLAPLFLAITLREPTRAADAETFRPEALKVLLRPTALMLLLFGTIYSTLGYGVEINLSLFYADFGFGESSIGHFGAARNLGRGVGALLVPVAASRFGRRGVLYAGVFGLAAATAAQATLGLAAAPAATGAIAGALGFAFGVFNGWNDALFCVLAMEASDPRMAASTYALFMAVTNVSVIGGSLFARVRLGLLGGSARLTFLAAGGAVLLALPLIGPLARHHAVSPREEADATAR